MCELVLLRPFPFCLSPLFLSFLSRSMPIQLLFRPHLAFSFQFFQALFAFFPLPFEFSLIPSIVFQAPSICVRALFLPLQRSFRVPSPLFPSLQPLALYPWLPLSPSVGEGVPALSKTALALSEGVPAPWPIFLAHEESFPALLPQAFHVLDDLSLVELTALSCSAMQQHFLCGQP